MRLCSEDRQDIRELSVEYLVGDEEDLEITTQAQSEG